MDPDGRKVDIIHRYPCNCWVDEFDAVYVAWPCERIGHHVTRRRLRQIVYKLRTSDPSDPEGKR